MEYDWYADLFFLEEVYRDVLILWLAAVLMRRRAEILRLLGAGIAGGLCSTGSVYLELMGRCPAGGQPVFAGIWEVWKLLVTGFLMIWIAFPGKQTMRQEKRNASADSGDSWMKVLKWRGKELGVLVLSAGILQSGLAILRERNRIRPGSEMRGTDHKGGKEGRKAAGDHEALPERYGYR